MVPPGVVDAIRGAHVQRAVSKQGETR
jgi:hypothetical protein